MSIEIQYTPRGHGRSLGRLYSQMLQVCHWLIVEPGRPITVVVARKEARQQFLDYAKGFGVLFEATKLRKWGKGAWQYDIKSFAYVKLIDKT